MASGASPSSMTAAEGGERRAAALSAWVTGRWMPSEGRERDLRRVLYGMAARAMMEGRRGESRDHEQEGGGEEEEREEEEEVRERGSERKECEGEREM
jgi:hypothetical protein